MSYAEVASGLASGVSTMTKSVLTRNNKISLDGGSTLFSTQDVNLLAGKKNSYNVAEMNMSIQAETFSMAEPDIIGFYSSTEAQKSNESEQWENGIFTKALLEGIKGKAVDEEGNITLDALELYIRNQVRQATNGRQMPIFENRQGNFILFEKK